MLFFLIFTPLNAILNTIPDEYKNIVKEAKENAIERSKYRILENDNDENDIFYPGHYTLNNFDFTLNAVVIGDKTKSLKGYAIDEEKKCCCNYIN